MNWLRSLCMLCLVMLASPVHAEPHPEPFAPGCAQGAGLAGGIAFAQRDWDFTTPGPLAFAGSPMLSVRCMGIGPFGLTTWFGVDMVPLYLHSYRRLGTRGPLLMMGTWGRGVRWNHQMFGIQLVSNGLVWGGGLRYSVQVGYKEGGIRPGIDVSLNVLAGVEPDLQLVVRHEVWHGMPRDPSERVKWRMVLLGFDLGPMLALRTNIRLKKGWFAPEIGFRLGSLTYPWANALLQPTLLSEMNLHAPGHPSIRFNRSDWYVRFAFGGGATLRDGRPVPLGGGALLFHAYDRQSVLRLGALAGADMLVADVGMGWVW